MRLRFLLPALLLAVPACSSDSGAAVAITATDTECRLADAHLDAGKTTFEVTNDGKEVTEVYVYAPGDKVVTEKEDIGPGTSARFSADLAAGKYEIACKPGQKGHGIRTDLHVSGKGGSAHAGDSYDREVELEAVDYAFTGLESFTAKAGEKIEFKMDNKGNEEHEFEVLGPDGTAIGEIGPTQPGKEGEVVLALTAAGSYRYVCGIEGHEAKGMKGSFTVT